MARHDVANDLSSKDDTIGLIDPLTQAAAIGALPPGHPDQVAFRRTHASDNECMLRLIEGQRVAELLGQLPVPAPPAPHLLERIAGQIGADLERARSPLPIVFGAALLAVGAWAGALVLTKHLTTGAPLFWSALLVASLGGAAVLLSRWGTWTMIGALAASVVAPLVLPHLFAPMVAPPLLGCLFVELAAAAAPVSVMAVAVLRGSRLVTRPVSFAAAAAVGALAGQLTLHAACPDVSLAHVYAFHTGAVFLAALLGWRVTFIPALRARLTA